ncbi:CLUMA_CG009626, isoform B [Clunio marinus]|uniref:Small integral membrane protein 14 n=1 Tax=Clunio marinus TaxID=568069 RepID=A0A1J1I7A9_9DIPT|nr:CLUMA_CG009626, isoform B [Clunio marinus]
MSDDQDSYDPCECVFSHEFAMRRLLNLLRHGQSECTDYECRDLVTPQTVTVSPSSDSSDNFTFMIFMMIAAVILYLIRPNSLRRRDEGLNKTSRDDHPSRDDQPPTAN